MAKFSVNVVVLVDNMPLVFFYFSPKPFKKKFLHSLYYEKKIRTKLPTKKKNSCKENFSTPLPGYLMVHPLIYVTTPQVNHIAPCSDLARYDADISKLACLKVKTRVSGSQIFLQESIAEILAGGVLVIFSSLVSPREPCDFVSS